MSQNYDHLRTSIFQVLPQEKIEKIMEALPHGGGIDCAWQHRPHSDRSESFINSIHCMDDSGGYDGYQDFKVILFQHKKDTLNPLKGPSAGKTQVCWRKGDWDFRIQFTGGYRKKYVDLWRDPLTEMIGRALEPFGIGKMRSEIIDAEVISK